MAKAASVPARIVLRALPDRAWDVSWASDDGAVAGSRTIPDPVDALILVEARRRDLRLAGYTVSICKGD